MFGCGDVCDVAICVVTCVVIRVVCVSVCVRFIGVCCSLCDVVDYVFADSITIGLFIVVRDVFARSMRVAVS